MSRYYFTYDKLMNIGDIVTIIGDNLVEDSKCVIVAFYSRYSNLLGKSIPQILIAHLDDVYLKYHETVCCEPDCRKYIYDALDARYKGTIFSLLTKEQYGLQDFLR